MCRGMNVCVYGAVKSNKGSTMYDREPAQEMPKLTDEVKRAMTPKGIKLYNDIREKQLKEKRLDTDHRV